MSGSRRPRRPGRKTWWAVVLATVFLLVPAGAAWADPGEIEWVRQFGSVAGGTDTAAAVDSDGNVYVAGRTEGPLAGQIGTSTDAFVRKYDVAGNVVWTRQLGGTGFEEGLGIAVDETGVYVGGYTFSALPGETSQGSADGFLTKYDFTGDVSWTRQFGTAGFEQVTGVSTADSGVYVAGSTSGTFPGEASAGGRDAFVRGYDASGNVLWTRQFGTSAADAAAGVSADASGVYLAGSTAGVFSGQVGAGGASDAFVRKYDPSGEMVWTRQFGTPSSDQASGVSADGASVYVAGTAGGALAGQAFLGGGADAFVRRYDAAGNEDWTRQFGTGTVDQAFAVDAGSSGAYVAGRSGSDAFVWRYDATGVAVWSRIFGTGQFDEAFGVAGDEVGAFVVGRTFGTFPGETTAGAGDAFVRRYDAAGTEDWTRQFGSPRPMSTVAADVDMGVAGDVYVAGWADGALDDASSAGGGDAFLRKYDAAGNVVWTRQFGSRSFEQALGVSADSSAVYVTGVTWFVLPGQTSAGSADVFVRKYDHAGNEVWTRQLGTPSVDFAHAVSAGPGGVYVAGSTVGGFQGAANAGSWDGFLLKLDSGGNLIWTRQFGTSASDEFYGLALDSSGVYVAGLTAGTFPGQSTAGGADGLLRKYHFDGTEVWTRQFGTPTSDLPLDVSAGASGVYVAGWTAGTFAGETSSGGRDAFVRRYDAAGTASWTRQFGTAGDMEWARAVSADATGVHVAGRTDGTLPGQASAGGRSDAFVLRYDASGALAGTSQFGTDGFDEAFAVAADPAGVYVAGQTIGVFPGQSTLGVLDGFVAKLPANRPPVAHAGFDQVVAEGATVTLDGSASFDPDGDPLVYAWTLAAAPEGSAVVVSGADTATPSFTAPDDGTYVFELTVVDGIGESDTDTVTVIVVNLSPTIGAVVAPTDPQAVGISVRASASFTDPDNDTHTCAIDWGDGSVSAGTVGAGACDGSHVYTAAGLYTVTVTVTDDDGGSDGASFQSVVVYDPASGFATGAGWIESPPGAYAPDPALAGRATFAFVSRYQRGASVPEGSMRFDLQPAGLRFRSTSYQWLVVAGSDAHLKGSGTIDGTGDYEFLLTATDGDPDRLRIEIRDRATGHLVYDNRPGDADGSTALGAGSVALHP